MEAMELVRARVSVPLGEDSYEIQVGIGSLTELGRILRENPIGHRYFIVTDDHVKDLLGLDLLQILRSEGLSADLLSFPAGEGSKTMETVVSLARRMVGLGADRKAAVIALGGGVPGDVAAFLASIYMRGIPFIQVPTTLLAQVDSSVGGKTGVDLPEGKNLLGTFAQPRAVHADVGVLATLPEREIRNGLAEVVKYGVIRDPLLFSLLEARAEEILGLDPELCVEIVARSCAIKAQVVSEDEKEGGLRRILNFGHTIGHAIEAAAGYAITHGEAVSLGMVAVSRIAVMKGLFPQEGSDRIRRLLERLRLPVTIGREFEAERLLGFLRHDKKAQAGKVHFVLPVRIGETLITPEVTDAEVVEAIEATR